MTRVSRWHPLGLAMALATSPVAAADGPDKPMPMIEVPAKHRLIEGIATDGETVWLSSVVDRDILVWRRGKRMRVMAMPPHTARPLGLAYDATRRWIWIATDCPRIAASDACTGGGLIAIDRRGRLKASLSPGGTPHFGDVSVADGIVQVSDSSTGAVYACRGACDILETIVPIGVGRSAQSSVRYDGGRLLLVADYGAGITRIDASGARTLIAREDGRPLRGVDGLVRAGAWFIAVQNSQSPGLVLAFRLAEDGAHLKDLQVLAAGADLPEPTQIAVRGSQILVVADAQWAAYDADKPVDRPLQHATRILALPVPR